MNFLNEGTKLCGYGIWVDLEAVGSGAEYGQNIIHEILKELIKYFDIIL